MNQLISELLLRNAVKLRREKEIIVQPGVNVPTRRRAKEMKKSFRTLVRKEQPDSMLNMARPPGHKSTISPGERTKMLFRAHLSRREAGWIRG